jgi:hypothetical protein
MMLKVYSGLTRNGKERQTKPYNADFDGDKFVLSSTGSVKSV